MSDIFGGPPDDQEYDPFGYPIDYAEVEDPHGFWHGDVPDDYWYDNITLGDVTLTNQEWHDLVMQPYDTAEELYGMDTYEILMDLSAMGYFDQDDWETWRNQYELQG